MTAFYVLMINMFIAGVFAVAFAVIAATIPTSRGAKWMATGYASGILLVSLEFVAATQTDTLLIGIPAFLAMLLSITCCAIGVSQHYSVQPPRRLIAGIWVASLAISPFAVAQFNESLLAATLYQLPYFVMQMLCAVAILRSHRRHPLDLLLLSLLALTSFTYIARPLIGLAVGMPDTAQTYMTTTYAAISQTIGAVTLIGLALVVLLAMIRHSTAEMMARSQTDVLSGALNRRGFEEQAAGLLEQADRSDVPVVLIAADLDHFKQINDTCGHEAGDRVIRAFAGILGEVAADQAAIIGRIGGEEFAVLLSGANLGMGRLCAERARLALSGHPDIGIGRIVTASFGVAQRRPGERLTDLLRRADGALYVAKDGGRNCVSIAPTENRKTSGAGLKARKTGTDAALIS